MVAAPASEAPASEAPPARGHASRLEVVAMLVLSFALAVAMWHIAWQHPLTTQLGSPGDSDEYSWFLAWVPYSIGHGLDPLISSYVNFPRGINLMWNTSVILPSFVMSPITLIFDAALSYNILITAAPALGATFAYIALRRWASPLPSLAGALIFGFNPYMVSQSVGHLAQTLMMSAPLMLILLDRLLVVQAKTPLRDGLLLGLLCWAQLLTAEETLALEGVTAVIAVVVLCALNWGAVAPHVRYAARGFGAGAALFVPLSAPFLAVQYLGPYRVQDVHPANVYVSDLFNFFVPTNITKFAPHSALLVASRFTGNGSEEGAYIGLPLLVFIALTLYFARRRGVTWVALAMGVGAGLLSLGPTLHVLGHVSPLPMPDDILKHFPTLHNLLPDRFASTMWLGVALLVAIGLDELKRLAVPYKILGSALGALGLVALLPITNYPAGPSPLYGAYVTGLACPKTSGPSSHPPVALLLPSVNELNLRWQPESKFCFVMPTDTGMTGTNQGDRGSLRLMLSLDNPGTALPPLTAQTRAEAAGDIATLQIKEIVIGPESPQSPNWSPKSQAKLVAWVEWLVGQAPLQSHDAFISYIWKDLPPTIDIASGHVGTVPGAY
jgi:hypothetical protein